MKNSALRLGEHSMVQVDTSIYNTKPAEPFNPLQSLGKYTDIANALQQNAATRQKMTETGVDIQRKQADLALQHYNNMQTLLAPLAADPNPTQEKMQNILISGITKGMITADEGAQERASWGEDNAANNKQIINSHMLRLQSAADQLKSTIGQNTQIDNGKQVISGVTHGVLSPENPGGFSKSSAVANELTPGLEAQRVEGIGPGGVPFSAPQSSLVTSTGMARGTPGASPGGNAPVPGGGSPAPSAAMQSVGAGAPGEENIPTGGSVSVKPLAAPTAQAGSEGVPGAVQTGYAPGTVSAANEVGQIAGKDLASDLQSLKESPATLYNMEAALENLKKAPTGQGAATRNAIKGAAIAFAPEVFKGTDWEHDVKAYDEANKYLTRQAQQAAASVGPHTNEGLASALSGNANTNINNLAAQDVQKANLALTRLNFARTAAFQHAMPNGTPQDYQRFGPEFNKNVDVRAFAADQMSKDQLKKLFSTIPKTLANGQPNPARQKFDNSYNMAVQYGLINHNSPQSQQNAQ
jgi:hypothetical protein